MFWDICPLTYLEDVSERKETQDAILHVLEKTLTIEHRACREGAFHGLGEVALACPEKVRAVIDRFLHKTKLDDKLLAYALNAQKGNVL
jgi:hypothetical protein